MINGIKAPDDEIQEIKTIIYNTPELDVKFIHFLRCGCNGSL